MLDAVLLLSDAEEGLDDVLRLYKKRRPNEFEAFFARTPSNIHGESIISAWEAYKDAHPTQRHFFRFGHAVATGTSSYPL